MLSIFSNNLAFYAHSYSSDHERFDFDIFDNEGNLRFVVYPTVIIHGGDDRLINYRSALYNSLGVRNLLDVFVIEGGTHTNIEEEHKSEWLSALREAL